MRAVHAGCMALVAVACTGARDQSDTHARIHVVWVERALAREPEEFEGLSPVVPAGALATLYGVATQEEARRLITTLRARGDSLIIGLGRPMLPVLRDARDCTRLWVGYDSTGSPADEGLRAWWAPTESLRLEIARLAAREGGTQVVLIGSSLGPSLLHVLQQSQVRVRPVSINPGEPFRGVLAGPDDVVLMVDAVPVPDNAWDRVFWACESPFQGPPRARAALHMDWRGAVSAAIQWHLGRGGVPPGPTLGPWLTLRIASEDS